MSDENEKYTLAEPKDPVYKLMREIVAASHSDIAEAEIAIVYEHDVKEDKDGHLRWGKAKKVGPLERKFHAHDFVISLNSEVWAKLPDSDKRALLDHELEHCAAETAEDGETKFYIRKHDLEEFNSIVRRHGLWRETIQSFIDAATKREEEPLFAEREVQKTMGPLKFEK